MTNRLSRHARRLRRKDMAHMVAAGGKTADVARHFGVCCDVVTRACHDHGVPLQRGRPPTSERTLDMLARLLNSDDKLEAIAIDFKITVQSVSFLMQRARHSGIKFPHREDREGLEARP